MQKPSIDHAICGGDNTQHQRHVLALGDAQREQLLAQIPLKRLGDPRDVAQAVLFLCSPGAAYITGETLHVNGGMYMG